jgi:hypothetical protein
MDGGWFRSSSTWPCLGQSACAGSISINQLITTAAVEQEGARGNVVADITHRATSQNGYQ